MDYLSLSHHLLIHEGRDNLCSTPACRKKGFPWEPRILGKHRGLPKTGCASGFQDTELTCSHVKAILALRKKK